MFNLSGIPSNLSVAWGKLGAPVKDEAGEVNNWPAMFSGAHSLAEGPSGGSGGGGGDAAALTGTGRTPQQLDEKLPVSEDLIRLPPTPNFGLVQEPTPALAPPQLGGGGAHHHHQRHHHPKLPTTTGSATATLAATAALTAAAAGTGTGAGMGAGAGAGAAAARPHLSAHHEHVFRFSSASGRERVSSQEVAKVRASALSRKRGVAFTAFPPRCTLPAFGHAVFSLGALADIPGAYADTLTISEAVVKGSVFSVTTAAPTLRARGALQAIGNPLLIAPGTTGLQGAAAATHPRAAQWLHRGPPPPRARGRAR